MPWWRQMLIDLIYKVPNITLRRQLFYLCLEGRIARIRHPRLMTEKINWRILKDRRPLLSWTCDKLAMKDAVAQLCPEVEIPRTYWTGTDLRDLLTVDLPERWILKPNHRSGFVHRGSGAVTDVADLERLTTGWLDETNMTANGEWAYGFAHRVFLAEEALGDGITSPDDLKFYAFDGETHLIQFEHDRFGAHHSRSHFDAEWNALPLKVGLEPAAPVRRPEQLEQMLDITRAIARQFDFMRIDLYLVDGKVYFGETTPYPASGYGRYDPKEFDRELGSHWILPDLNAHSESA